MIKETHSSVWVVSNRNVGIYVFIVNAPGVLARHARKAEAAISLLFLLPDEYEGPPCPQTLGSTDTSRHVYAFLLFPPFFALDPVTSAASAPSPATRASSCSAVKSPSGKVVEEALARLGSSFPMAGTVEASMVWKGVATKWPFSSNHSVKERVRLRFWDLPPDLGVRVIVRL